MSTAKILIVDDDPLVRDFLRKAFRQVQGGEIEVAEDGQQALQMLGDHPFDLCILDLFMPVMDGFEVLQGVRKRGIRTAIIVLTGYGTMERGVEAMKRGAKDFLTKPIEIKKVIAAAQQLLAENSHPFPHVLAGKLDSFVAENATNSFFQLGYLLKHFQISRSYSCRLFRECLGTTFRSRLAFHRVQKVKEWLETTDKTLRIIAEECGFRNQQRLREAFQRLEGVNPKKYREICRLRRQNET